MRSWIILVLPCLSTLRSISGFAVLTRQLSLRILSNRIDRPADCDTNLPGRLHTRPPDPPSKHPSQPKVMNIKNGENDRYEFWGESLSLAQFNMDLQNLAIEPDKAKDALEIMGDMFEKDPEKPYTVQPDVTCYNTVIEGYVAAEQPQQADDLLAFLEDSDRLEPNEQSYMLVAQGWAQSAKSDILGKQANKSERVLRRMQQRGQVEPSVKVYTIVLEGWCKRSGNVRGAMGQADALLKEMEGQAGNKSVAVGPNVLTYTSYIGGLARCRERDLASQADAVLERMEKRGVQADMVTYTSVLNCWSKATSKRERHLAASRALEILDKMERLYQQEVYHCKPSLVTYATAIRAIGHSFDANAPDLVQNVLRRMYKLHETGTIANLKPNTATYNAVLNSLSRARHDRVLYAKRAEEILADMESRARNGEVDVKPDVRTWAAVLRGWAKCGRPDAAEQAERVLNKLDTRYNVGDSQIRPNYVCYTQCMGAWSNSRNPDALDRMEGLLKRMEQGYKESREADIRPNTVSYVTAIDAFVRRDSENAATRAQATVDRMTDLYNERLGHVRPTLIIFNTLIHAWSKSKEENAALKAERIFQWMGEQYEAGDDLVRPDAVSIAAVLNAWANNPEAGGAARAIEIYRYIDAMSVEERGFHLSIMIPNIVVKAIARSQDKDSVKKAEALLEKLEREYKSGNRSLRPDVTTYSSIINCCAYYRYPEGRAYALETALRTFKKVCDSEEENPNNITYGTVLKAISKQMPSSAQRDKLTRKLFRQCRTEGFVDGFVLSQVRSANMKLYNELRSEFLKQRGKDENGSMLRNMPREWSENVVL